MKIMEKVTEVLTMGLIRHSIIKEVLTMWTSPVFLGKSMLIFFFIGLVSGTALCSAQVAKPIAMADGDNPDLRVEVQELKRSGDGTVTLKFVMYNNSDKSVNLEDQFNDGTWSKDREDISGVHLIDGTNKKKYLVVQDSQKNCVCSKSLKRMFEAKSRMNLWAKFPAPPDEVKKVTVVIPHFIPMDGVAIE